MIVCIKINSGYAYHYMISREYQQLCINFRFVRDFS